MKWAAIMLALIVLGLLAWRILRIAPHLRAGDTAPAFELKDQQTKVWRLADYRGRWLVLYFYPKDDTPGCTREACHFRDDILTLRGLHADVAGISVDNADSHARFATKYHLPFPLLADTDGEVATAYGVLLKLGPLKMARRVTFIITPDGRIGRIFRHVNPANHAAEIAQALKTLQIEHAPVKLAPAL